MKTILFDLDGTLLPMEQDEFVRQYIRRFAETISPLGYEPETLVHALWAGVGGMMRNDGAQTNESAFWKVFSERLGPSILDHRANFDAFYRTRFQEVRESCSFNPKVPMLIDDLKRCGYTLAVATNPVFPEYATFSRIRWAGLKPEDFALITTYENSRHTKPNPQYYADVCDALGVKPEDCLMVGNDVDEDLVAERIGMRVFFLTDCPINASEKDVSACPQGDFDALRRYIFENA